MSAKAIIILCLQAAFIQAISAQYIGAIDAYGYGGSCGFAPLAAAPCAGAWGAPYAEWAYAPASTLAASNGPGVAVASASPLIPAGVSVLSENVYEGSLAAGGALPFLGTVAIEGALPTAGAGAISYGCGNGAVAITAEDLAAYGFNGIAGPLGYGPGITGPIGYGAGIAGPIGYGPGYGACGCGALY